MHSLASALLTTAHAGGHTRVNPVLLAMAGLVGGFAVGVTGMGGGALMTPALVLLFKIDPVVAVASDLVNSLVMKPIGAGVHLKRGTIHWSLVGWMVAGSVPSAFFGAFVLNQFGDSKQVQTGVKELLGWALLLASTAIVARSVLTARARQRRTPTEVANEQAYVIKPIPTLLVGVVGGFIVGMTSVGSGSLMIVLLMLLYPRLSSKSLVGTDLMQAIPSAAEATLGQFFFGHINFGVAGALILGSVPGVYLGARFSSHAPDRIVRPILVGILVASALALLIGSNYNALAFALATVVVTAIPLWGAVDATLRRTADWQAIGRSRTRWVAVQGLGAPFGIGLLASAVYFFHIRRRLVPAPATPTTPTA